MSETWTRAMSLASWGALLVVLGCRSPEAAEPPLPFHVALIPVTVDRPFDRDLAERDVESEAGDEPPVLNLFYRSDDVTTRVEAALRERSFTQLTTMGYPAASSGSGDSGTGDSGTGDIDSAKDRAGFFRRSTRDRDRHWIRVATEQGADLVVEVSLAYQFEVEPWINNKFWLNLPLFGLGGPFCYFVADRSYDVNLILNATLYDLNLISRGAAELGTPSAMVLTTEVRTESVDLNFIDRAGGHLGLYAASVLVPAGLLAIRSDSVAEQVRERALQSAIDGLVERVFERRREVVEAASLVDFRLSANHLRIVRSEAGWEVSGAVLLPRERGRDGLSRIELRIDDGDRILAKFDGEIDEVVIGGPTSNRSVAVVFSASIASEADARYLRLRIVDSTLNENARSFTFALPSGRNADSR